MRIGFNLWPYTRGQHGGAEVYLTQVIHEMIAAGPQHHYVLFGERDVLEQFPQAAAVEKVPARILRRRPRALRILQEQTVLPIAVLRRRLDLLVSNYVVPIAAPTRHVVVVHDMLCRRYPETLERSKRWFWSMMLPLSISRATHVATVSEFSASEIRHFYPSAEPKVFVTVEGVRPSLERAGESGRPDWLGDDPFVVAVVTFGKHKNLDVLARAFAAIAAELARLRLVLVGAARTPDAVNNRDHLRALLTDLGVAPRITFANHVSDGALGYLYAHARCTVLPSLYEGFGLPVIEAQHFGCPVVCSDRGSLPEVAGEGATVFTAESAAALATALRATVADETERARLRVAGRRNVERFSWRRAALQMLAALAD